MSFKSKLICSNADTCDWCGAFSTIRRCSNCREARYCGKACQASHWIEHKGLCQQIQDLDGNENRKKKLCWELVWSSFDGNLSEVRRLLALGADARYKLQEGRDKGLFPLYLASQEGHLGVIETLISEGGAFVNQLGPYDSSSLYIAAAKNRDLAIKMLAKAGANVNVQNIEGGTALLVAVQRNFYSSVVALLVAKADVNKPSVDGITPLYCASARGFAPIVQLLLSTKGCGANVNQPNGSGSTPLFAAAKNGHLHVVELLIRAGASVLQLNNHANSILQAAVSHGSVEIVELLLAAGGPGLHHKDMDGDTALDMAINLKHTAVEAVLRAHIAKLEA